MLKKEKQFNFDRNVLLFLQSGIGYNSWIKLSNHVLKKRVKISAFNYIKMKHFCSKNTIKRIKTQAIDWEKAFTVHVTKHHHHHQQQKTCFQIYKELLKFDFLKQAKSSRKTDKWLDYALHNKDHPNG